MVKLRHSIGHHMVKLHLEGKLVILVNMNSVPLINHSTQVLHQLQSTTCDETNKTLKLPYCCKPMFHMFHDFVASFKLVMLHYNVAIFQGMRTHVAFTCCTNHNSQAILYETNIIENVAYTCFR
jgi:hypothetical protein